MRNAACHQGGAEPTRAPGGATRAALPWERMSEKVPSLLCVPHSYNSLRLCVPEGQLASGSRPVVVSRCHGLFPAPRAILFLFHGPCPFLRGACGSGSGGNPEVTPRRAPSPGRARQCHTSGEHGTCSHLGLNVKLCVESACKTPCLLPKPRVPGPSWATGLGPFLSGHVAQKVELGSRNQTAERATARTHARFQTTIVR